MGTAYSEPTLIRLASGFEATTRARVRPGLAATLPLEKRRAGVPATRGAATGRAAARRLAARLRLSRSLLRGL
jgi:hypothetical protein